MAPRQYQLTTETRIIQFGNHLIKYEVAHIKNKLVKKVDSTLWQNYNNRYESDMNLYSIFYINYHHYITMSENLPYKAVQAWLMTSRHTVPDTSSMFGW